MPRIFGSGRLVLRHFNGVGIRNCEKWQLSQNDPTICKVF